MIKNHKANYVHICSEGFFVSLNIFRVFLDLWVHKVSQPVKCACQNLMACVTKQMLCSDFISRFLSCAGVNSAKQKRSLVLINPATLALSVPLEPDLSPCSAQKISCLGFHRLMPPLIGNDLSCFFCFCRRLNSAWI